jgi:hypothetical protein
MSELFESNKAELDKTSTNLHESYKLQHTLTQEHEKSKKDLEANNVVLKEKNNTILELEEK